AWAGCAASLRVPGCGIHAGWEGRDSVVILPHVGISLECHALVRQFVNGCSDISKLPTKDRILRRRELRNLADAEHRSVNVKYQRKPVIAHETKTQSVAIEGKARLWIFGEQE